MTFEAQRPRPRHAQTRSGISSERLAYMHYLRKPYIQRKEPSLHDRSPEILNPQNANPMQVGITLSPLGKKSSPRLDPGHELNHLYRVLARPPHPLLLHILLPILDLPGARDLLTRPSHAVDGDDQRFEESDAGALEHVHGHEGPA